MKLKSLLIGSAALMAAATGAKAADAIVVPEPEPMEYVRVCDVYGAGFFYIPGTETCLKIGGYVRYQIDWSESDNDSVGFTSGWDFEEEAGGWRKMARANLTIDARSETEYGTLGSFIELRADTYSGTAAAGTSGLISLPGEAAVLSGPLGGIENGITRGVYLNQAYISLGGFFVGLKTTIWDQALSGEFDKGGYDGSVHTMGYSFVPGNGLAVTVALEEYDYNYDYTPNVVGKVSLTQGWGSVAGFVAYDATAEEWALKGFASIKATQQLTLELLAMYSSDPNVYGVGYDYTFGGYLKYAATPKLSVGFGGQYFGDRQSSSVLLSGNDDWALGAVVDYKVVDNFNTKLAINYNDGDSYADGAFSGFIRFQRDF